jgi:aspartate-semialdehyde dehydrogenase
MYSIGIVGATGAVGTEMLRVLEDRMFPVSDLHLFASANSIGKTILFRGKELAIEALDEHSFHNLDLALFSAGSEISKQWRNAAGRAGCIVIDNSSAFRMEPDVPLVIPEINAEDLRSHRGIIAVPNCSTIILLMAVAPLRTLGAISRIVVSTYQAVSGAGAWAMHELEEQSRLFLRGAAIEPAVLPHPIAFNLFCHNSAINAEGYNGEEWKMIQETKKILHDDRIKITATCVRVPVFRAHSESVNIEFSHDRPSIEEIRTALVNFPGVKVVDDRAGNVFPMPKDAAGEYDVLVGHIRYDVSNPNAIDLFVSGDQLLKGAALDAIQIAESLIHQSLLRPKRKSAMAA